MKSLNLAKPLVIMMVGLPGAGKSFFAKRFSETFGAPVVSYDRIRFELFSQPQYSSEENEIVNRLAEYQVEELTKTKRTFIVDGGCNAKTERLRLRDLTKDSEYETLVVWVQTHEPTAQTRATKRSSRRADDKYNPSISQEQFTAFSRRLTPPSRGENYTVISGMHTYSTQAKAVLRRLVVNREADADAAHKSENEATLQRTRGTTDTNRRSIILR